jgi:hypothetical protein
MPERCTVAEGAVATSVATGTVASMCAPVCWPIAGRGLPAASAKVSRAFHGRVGA